MYTQHRSHFPEQRASVSCGSPTKFANDSRNEAAALPLLTSFNRSAFHESPTTQHQSLLSNR